MMVGTPKSPRLTESVQTVVRIQWMDKQPLAVVTHPPHVPLVEPLPVTRAVKGRKKNEVR